MGTTQIIWTVEAIFKAYSLELLSYREARHLMGFAFLYEAEPPAEAPDLPTPPHILAKQQQAEAAMIAHWRAEAADKMKQARGYMLSEETAAHLKKLLEINKSLTTPEGV